MAYGDIVKDITVTKEVSIREFPGMGEDGSETWYDWISENGDSDVLFETIEEAVRNAKDHA